MMCVGILFTYCFVATPSSIQDYCQLYQPTIIAKGEGSISAQSTVKRRILANELTYKKLCGK